MSQFIKSIGPNKAVEVTVSEVFLAIYRYFFGLFTIKKNDTYMATKFKILR